MRKTIAASIEESKIKTLRENYEAWGFRNLSHAIEHAIGLLIEERKK